MLELGMNKDGAHGAGNGSRAVRAVFAVGSLSVVLACQAPDRPSAVSEPLSPSVVELLRPDTSRALRVAPGVLYRYLWSPVGPWAIHVLEADISSCRVGFDVVRAPGNPGTEDARREVSGLMAMAPEGAVAAVNGDFFTLDGAPQGTEISTMGLRSEVPVSALRRPAFSWSPVSGPRIGSLDELGMAPEKEMGDPGTIVVSGFPELLDGGGRVGDLEVQARQSFAGVRHPRTAVAYSEGLRRLWFVVVEGRLGSRSAGMTLPEVNDLLLGLGAEDALNLDGGGSSVMVLGSRPVSRPSDEEGERPVANALVIRSGGEDCPT